MRITIRDHKISLDSVKRLEALGHTVSMQVIGESYAQSNAVFNQFARIARETACYQRQTDARIFKHLRVVKG